MMDHATQTNIKQARDMLVGKIPSPIDQCHEITKALIYKFISDNDRESLALGGEPFYFPDTAAEYRWDNLMERRQTADDMRRLYHAGLEYIGNRNDIPDAFRAIYKDALLPYNIDAGTLRLFLETINKFATADTETIGVAFEHLLMDTGAQGKAGQFRTPRHIIDFIVAIINPQTHESILDPACGTAGFLASAYQHISANAPVTLGSPERKAIASNLVGYDLSPDMVKLATIHMYLQHGQSPPVEIYDTISDDGHWNDHYDVILANPPFMTPTGAIKPNQRFYTQASKTEVLFVDYIAGHLNEKGRAGVIVPEGIVFRRDNAYRQLRRLMVEHCLVAVISLPAGVFNPYSGVKTSILIMDKALAKQASNIAFFKATSDGFDLGAQRRPIATNDLPHIHKELSEYLRRVREDIPMDDFSPSLGHLVAKEQIAASGDYRLSGERYHVRTAGESAYPRFPLGSLIETITPPVKIPKSEFGRTGLYPIIDQSQQNEIAGYTNDAEALMFPDRPLVIFGDHTCAVKLAHVPFAQGADGIKIISTKEELDPYFLFHMLRNKPLESDGYRRHFALLKAYEMPLPPLDFQREIVQDIEGCQKLIDHAHGMAESYRPHIDDDPTWPTIKIGDIATVQAGNPAPQGSAYFENGVFPFVRTVDVGAVHQTAAFTGSRDKVNQKAVTEKRLRLFPAGTILFPKSGASTFLNHRVVLAEPAYVASHLAGIICDETRALPKYVYHRLCQVDARTITADQSYPSLRASEIAAITMPLPPLETQQDVVDELDAEQAAVDNAQDLAARMQQRIDVAIARVWHNA